MKKPRDLAVAWMVILGAAALFSGCAAVSSTARRAGMVATGAAIGGAGAYAISDHDPVKSVAGAVAGAALTHLAMGADPAVRQEGFDIGYIQGQSDSIKRQYFLRHAREAEPPTHGSTEGKAVYYVMPGPEVTVDGRKLEPHQVAVRVVE